MTSSFNTCISFDFLTTSGVAQSRRDSGTTAVSQSPGETSLRDPALGIYEARFGRALIQGTSPIKHLTTIGENSAKAERRSLRNAAKLSNQSTFRPPVPANKRLSAWSSPYAMKGRENISSILPRSLLAKTYEAVEGAIAPTTRGVYGAGLLRFHQFCDEFGIAEEDRMPASAPLLASFVAHCKGKYAGKTISLWLSGIRYWHIFNRAEWKGEDEWVSQTRTAANKEGTSFRRPKRAPVSHEHLEVLLEKLDLADSRHAAYWAVALVTFFGCRRLGETTVKSKESFSQVFNVVNTSEFRFRLIDGSGASTISIRIPWTKTTKQEGAVIVLTSRLDRLCPVKAVLNHLAVNFGRPPGSSFFSFKDNSPEGWRHTFRDEFLGFVTDRWNEARLSAVSGHSFRIGGAVSLLLAGVPPEIVAKTGGWTSLAFLIYWRRVEEIIPLHTSKAYAGSDISRVAGAVESFRISHRISRDDIEQGLDS